MSAGAPWSVKGIDAKAREVAKDLARRSGMTLGEWLNQMILEGQDVAAMIRDERQRSEEAVGSVAAAAGARQGFRGGWGVQASAPADDMNRVARALETLSSRIEASEHRSGGAVRSVSAAVESLLNRLEQDEGARPAETTAPESDDDLFVARLGKAERQLTAQNERLEGLSGHVRDARERVERLEAQVQDAPAGETLKALEGTLGKLANQLYEGEARSRDSFSAMRDDMVGLSHRLAQLETRDPDRVAQGLIDKVVAQMSQRLEAAEAQTTGAIRQLETAFQALEQRMHGAPETAGALGALTGDLSQHLAQSREEWRQALADSRQGTLDEVMARVGAAEKRSATAIEKLGQDVLRVAGNLNRRMTGVETASREGLHRMGNDLQRIAGSIEARIARGENSHAQALERLGGEIARISERLNTRLGETERRTNDILSSLGEQVGQQRDHVRDDLAERIRQSEERTAKLLEETRARIDDKLARVQTETLLSEAVRAPQTVTKDEDLPSPFASEPASAPRAAVKAAAHEADRIDLTGHLLGGVTGGGFDPFESEGLEDDLEPASAFAAQDEDEDPFAEIDLAHKTAPAVSVERPALTRASFATDDDVLTSDFDDLQPGRAGQDSFSYELEPDPLVSMSTRDALAAARAAVRASIEGQEDRGLLGGLKGGASRRQAAAEKANGKKSEKAGAGKGGTGMNALKASSVAAALMVVGATGYLAFKNATPDAPAGAVKGQPLAAAAIDITSADGSASAQDQLRTRYDLAVKALDARAPGAVEALKTVADQGYAPAQYKLSLLYNGQDHILPTDKAQARLWTQRAAEGGVAKAMYNLGSMYYQGEGGAQDHSKAAVWFRKAAERGVRDSQYNLGVLYERGDGVPLNPTEAYKWLRIVGNSGDKVAAREADDLAGQLTDEQRQRAEDAVTHFTPITDGAPVAGSES